MANSLKILLKTPTWLTIILGAFLLLLQKYNGEISQNIQIAFFVSLILLTGIPHGALDHLIQQTTDNQHHRKYSIKKFLLKYIFIMVGYGLVWYFFSGFSFMIFLFISAWHFGETDLENAPQNAQIWSITRLVYGIYVLTFILLSHIQEVSPILERMIAQESKTMVIWDFVKTNNKQILYLLGLSLATIFIVAQSEYFIVFDKVRLVRLGLILFLSFYLPLLPAFALYFGGWHSLCAFDSIHGYLQKDQPALTFKSVYLKALPFSILAIIFLGLFLWYCQKYTKDFNPFSMLFIFISLITLPHLMIANQMNSVSK